MILLGAGHAHLLLIERAKALREAALDPLLIAPKHFHYSGLATGVLSGALPEDANRIDVAALAERHGIAFIEEKAASIDKEAKNVTLRDGRTIGYDLLSLNIGSEIARPIPGEGEVRPVKPLSQVTHLRFDLEAAFEQGRHPVVVIAGAGPTGTEVAASIAGLVERRHARADILLVGRPVEGWESLYADLRERGVILFADRRVVERSADHVQLDDGAYLRCDFCVAATGLAPNPLGTSVGATLQSRDDAAIFAAGDCAHFLPRTLPMLGVFGVRQAPILARNLIAAARGEPLRPYRPQRRWLSILDLGNGEGLATWGNLTHRSRAALH
ncbi:MAG TPA: FAD-dependent oxidoreductase, partial [Allosphingosinicella sp.]